MILMIIIITIQQNRIYQLEQSYLNEVNEDVIHLDKNNNELPEGSGINLRETTSTDVSTSQTKINASIVPITQEDEIPPVIQIPRRFMPVNIHTRGQYEYTQVGVISDIDEQTNTQHTPISQPTHTLRVVSEDGQQTTYESTISQVLPTNSTSTRTQILPLYGRPTYPASNKWNFYTSTDGYHLLRIPVFYKNKNCTGEYGCDELYDGDFVRVEEYGKTYRVRLYETEQLRYIPFY